MESSQKDQKCKEKTFAAANDAFVIELESVKDNSNGDVTIKNLNQVKHHPTEKNGDDIIFSLHK